IPARRLPDRPETDAGARVRTWRRGVSRRVRRRRPRASWPPIDRQGPGASPAYASLFAPAQLAEVLLHSIAETNRSAVGRCAANLSFGLCQLLAQADFKGLKLRQNRSAEAFL